MGKKQVDAKRLINELYRQPILDGSQVAELLGIHPSTANRLIRDFQQIGILKELTGYKRNRIFAFEEYIELLASHEKKVQPAENSELNPYVHF